MPFELDVDPSKGRLYAKATGKLTVDDFRSGLDRSIANRNFLPSLPQLFDLREAQYTPTDDDVEEMTATLELLKYALKGKIALVAATQSLYLMGKLLAVRAETEGVALEVFVTIADAYEWLGVRQH